MVVFFFKKRNIAYFAEILRFKVFGLVTTFEEKEEDGCLLKRLRGTTSACYRLGYSYVIVDRVFKSECEAASLEVPC